MFTDGFNDSVAMSDYILNVSLVVGAKLEPACKTIVLHRANSYLTFKTVCNEVVCKCKERDLIVQRHIAYDFSDTTPVVYVTNKFDRRVVDFEETLDIAPHLLSSGAATVQYVFPEAEPEDDASVVKVHGEPKDSALDLLMKGKGVIKLRPTDSPTTTKNVIINDIIAELQRTDEKGILKYTHSQKEGRKCLRPFADVIFYLDGRMQAINNRSTNNPTKVPPIPKRSVK